MSPDATDWRSDAAYDYVDQIAASDLAWEWLRRNEDYRDDFAALSAATEQREALAEHISQRWNLRFPGSSRPQRIRSRSDVDARYRHRLRHPGTCAALACKR